MKETDKNIVSLIIKEEIDKTKVQSENYTKDRIDLIIRIFKYSFTTISVLLTVIGYFGIPYLIKTAIDNKIGDTVIRSYSDQLDSVVFLSKSKADSLNSNWLESNKIFSKINKLSKSLSSSELVGNLYVNDLSETASSISRDNLPVNTWIPVPHNKQNGMKINISVRDQSEIYLIVYSYRVKYSDLGTIKSAVFIMQNDSRIRELYGDGNQAMKQNSEHQFSSAFIVKDLQPGKYSVELFDYSENSPTRVFIDPRQLAVYKL